MCKNTIFSLFLVFSFSAQAQDYPEETLKAFNTYMNCSIEMIRQLDDQKTDPKTIAAAVSTSCTLEYLSLISAISSGQTEGARKAFKTQMDSARINSLIALVLKVRKIDSVDLK